MGRNDGAVSVTTTTLCLALNTGYSYIYHAGRGGNSETKNLVHHHSSVNVRVRACLWKGS